MNTPLFISRRLRLTTAGAKANTTGVIIAVAGVALAIIVMEITLAVVAGFKHGITEKLMGFEGQVSVLPAYDYTAERQEPYITLTPELADAISHNTSGAPLSLKFSMPGLLKTDDDFAGIYLTARNHDYAFDFERSCVTDGIFPDYSDEDNGLKLVLSRTVARSMGLETGDKINVCFFIDDAVRMRRFEIAALYESGFAEYDASVAFASLSTLQRLARVDSLTATSVELAGISIPEAAGTAERLQSALLSDYHDGSLPKLYPVDNITHTGASYLSWLALLDTNVVVIFILMLCVAAFTLISSMFILILERIPTIGILRAMGAPRAFVRRVFMLMAMKVVGTGMIIGNVLGIGLLLLQKHLQFIHLDPKVYYLHFVPVEISPLSVLLLNIGAVVAAWLILILPSSMASRVSPAVTMRFD